MATPGADSSDGSGAARDSAFSLQPWSTNVHRKPRSIREFVARINQERGGFRNVTQAGLLAEILERDSKAAAAGNDGDVDMADGADEEDEDEDEDEDENEEDADPDADDTLDAYEAKGKMLQCLECVARRPDRYY